MLPRLATPVFAVTLLLAATLSPVAAPSAGFFSWLPAVNVTRLQSLFTLSTRKPAPSNLPAPISIPLTSPLIRKINSASNYSLVAYCQVEQWSCHVCLKYHPLITHVVQVRSRRARGFVAVNPKDRSVIIGFRALKTMGEILAVVLRGSKTVYPYASDWAIRNTVPPKRVKVHAGWFKAYEAAKSQYIAAVQNAMSHLTKVRSVHVGGVSYGGPLAVLCAAHIATLYPKIKVQVFTHGAPRFLSPEMRRYLLSIGNLEIYRATLQNDIIPQLRSPEGGWAHAGVELFQALPTEEQPSPSLKMCADNANVELAGKYELPDEDPNCNAGAGPWDMKAHFGYWAVPVDERGCEPGIELNGALAAKLKEPWQKTGDAGAGG